MTIYITQGRHTEEGLRGLCAKPEDRTGVLSALCGTLGGKLIGYYYTFGFEWDFVLITEFPDEVAAGAAALATRLAGGTGEMRSAVATTPEKALQSIEKARQIAYRAPGRS